MGCECVMLFDCYVLVCVFRNSVNSLDCELIVSFM